MVIKSKKPFPAKDTKKAEPVKKTGSGKSVPGKPTKGFPPAFMAKEEKMANGGKVAKKKC